MPFILIYYTLDTMKMPKKTVIKQENIKVYAVLLLLLYLILKLLSLAFTVLLRPMRWLLKILFLVFIILLVLSLMNTNAKRSA